ncbi:MAG: nuclear transport factor 2 family protein [Sphingomonadaceae bacterium]
MNSIEQLNAIEEIKQLKARYFECLDGKDWPAYETVFATDAMMDAREAFSASDPLSGESRIYGRPDLLAGMDTSEWVTNGAAAIAANAAALLGSVCTVHRGHMPRITILSADEATGMWGMEDLLRFPAGLPITEIRGHGHYHEHYIRIDGRWLIHSTRLTRLRIDVS